jgi:hypothetical protein
MRADIHGGSEHSTLQSEAGYIDARPQGQIDQALLQRTAAPYIWVKLGSSSHPAERQLWGIKSSSCGQGGAAVVGFGKQSSASELPTIGLCWFLGGL